MTLIVTRDLMDPQWERQPYRVETMLGGAPCREAGVTLHRFTELPEPGLQTRIRNLFRSRIFTCSKLAPTSICLF
jgi:hypothetical protein